MAKAPKSADEQLHGSNVHNQPLDAFAEKDWCVEDDLQFCLHGIKFVSGFVRSF